MCWGRTSKQPKSTLVTPLATIQSAIWDCVAIKTLPLMRDIKHKFGCKRWLFHRLAFLCFFTLENIRLPLRKPCGKLDLWVLSTRPISWNTFVCFGPPAFKTIKETIRYLKSEDIPLCKAAVERYSYKELQRTVW